MAIEDHSPQVIAVVILFLTLAWVLTLLRCYVRIYITRLFRSDDWLALVTLGVYTIYCSFVLAGAKDGTGRHLSDLSEEDIVMAMKWWYSGEITYVLTTCLVKVYIAAFLRQTCLKGAQIIVIWTTGTIFSIFSIYYLFLMIVQCHPISYFWTRYISGSLGTCISPTVIVDSTYAHGVLSATVDWTLGMLPVFLVWNLNMDIRTKVSVALILALGAVGSIATVVRVFYIHQLSHTQDFLFANTGVSIWSTVEPGMGIAASSLACLRPLFRRIYHSSSMYLGSVTTVNHPGNLSRPHYVSSERSRNRREELELQNNFAKAIHVTTVINTHSSRDTERGDEEVGTGGRIHEGSEITIVSSGEDGWNKSVGSISYEMGRFTPVPGETSVGYQAGAT